MKHFAYLFCLFLYVLSPNAHSSEIPSLIAYQGVLELQGQPVNGVKTLRFYLYKNNTEVVWQETHETTLVSGRFSLLLGSKTTAPNQVSIHQVLNRGWDMYLRIAIVENGQETLLDGSQRLTPTPYSIRPVVHEVPIGAVIDWWCPPTSTPCVVPPHYVVADGTPINDTESPLHGQTTPDLRGMFIRGASSIENASGTVKGGASEHTHQTLFPAHQHAYDINHTHAPYTQSTESAGRHVHIWATHQHGDLAGRNVMWKSGDGDTPFGRNSYNDFEPKSSLSPSYSFLAIEKKFSQAGTTSMFYTASDGYHHHPITVSLPNHTQSKMTESFPERFLATQPSDHSPPYVELLKIIRIK
jgi:hypothetical protein